MSSTNEDVVAVVIERKSARLYVRAGQDLEVVRVTPDEARHIVEENSGRAAAGGPLRLLRGIVYFFKRGEVSKDG